MILPRPSRRLGSRNNDDAPKTAATTMPTAGQRRILVTGGTGLVGRALRHEVDDDPAFFFACSDDGDLRSALQTELLFQRVRPTHVIHLATRVAGPRATLADTVGCFIDNLRIHGNVLEACKHHAIQKTVVCPPCSDDGDGCPHASNTASVLARRLAAATGKTYVCVLSDAVYGPCRNDAERPGPVQAMVRDACDEPVLRVCGDAAARRCYVYSGDVARALVWALDNYDDCAAPLVLAPPHAEVSAKTVATMIQLLTGCPALQFGGGGGEARPRPPLPPGRPLPPDFEYTSLRDGLERTIVGYLVERGIMQRPMRGIVAWTI